jgi:hypothetical protein
MSVVICRKQPRVNDGKVRRHNSEEQEEEADDLRDVEGVVRLENEGENDEGDDGKEDNDPGYSLGPGFVIAGEHLGSPLLLLDRYCKAPIALAAGAGSTCYQYGSVSRAEAVVYIYY